MIASVTIKGFQSHINSQFHLSPGLTVITGPTDSGKTAIIRAVRWVALNEPSGDNFVNDTAGEAEVEIRLDGGTVITKKRKKGGRTTYKLNDSAFEQADVPPEVTAALGITRQTFGDFETALNFAFQLEAPFLISEPPSAGAKVLGVIAGTEIVDLAIKATSKDTHAARAERLKADQEVQQNEKDLLQYADLDALLEQGQACETLMKQFDELSARAAALRLLQGQYLTIVGKISTLEQRIAGLNLDVVTPLVEWMTAEHDRYSRLNALNEKAISHGLVIRACGSRLERLAGIPEAAGLLQSVEQNARRKHLLIDLMSRLIDVVQALQTAEATLESTRHLNMASSDIDQIEQNMRCKGTLVDLAARYCTVTKEVLRIDLVLQSSKDIDVAAAQVTELAASVGRPEALKQLRMQHQAVTLYLRDRETVLKATTGIVQAAALLASAAEKRDRLQQLRETASIFRVKDDTLRQAAARIPTADKAIIAQEQLLQGLWSELNVCPLCEQPIMKGEMIHGH